MRPISILVSILALAASLSPARADHCGSNIYLFTSYGADGPPGAVVLTSSAIGCTVLGGEDPDTDVIYPGSNRWQVRYIINAMPVSGTVDFAGKTVPLVFSPGTLGGLGVGGPQAYWDSQWFTVDPVETIRNQTARVTVCLDLECSDDKRDTREYRTLY